MADSYLQKSHRAEEAGACFQILLFRRGCQDDEADASSECLTGKRVQQVASVILPASRVSHSNQ